MKQNKPKKQIQKNNVSLYHLLQDAYIIFNTVENFEIAHKRAQFCFGVAAVPPLRLRS